PPQALGRSDFGCLALAGRVPCAGRMRYAGGPRPARQRQPRRRNDQAPPRRDHLTSSLPGRYTFALRAGPDEQRSGARARLLPASRRVATIADRRSAMAMLAAGILAAAMAAANAVEVTIHEWDVPTPNARPHDPAVAPDGALWFTEQMANKLGRLDPR